MRCRLPWMKALPVLLFAATASCAVELPIQRLAEKIDEHLARRWTKAKVEPAPRADDAEFLRRVYLDLTGRIPSVEQTRSFLDDRRADKRTRLIGQLLTGSRYPIHFANVWRSLLLPEADSNFLVQAQQESFQNWLKQQLSRNVGYDQMVRSLLTAKFAAGNGLAVFAGYSEPGPQAFYFAKEFKAENLAAGTARVFLGVSVECAQCHNHPFAEWKREQFWGMAAFFAGIKSRSLMDFLIPDGEDAHKHELTLPGSDRVIQARFLDGSKPDWKDNPASRETLAAWVTAKDNPYFARATVNRLWAHFFGTGLIEPVSEMVGANSTASHPELLDLLAHEFVDHEFDLKFIMRAITASRAYQLSSARTHRSQDDPTLFARMPLRGLTAEQLFDSVAMATGYRDTRAGGENIFANLLGLNRSARAEFLIRFASSERAVDSQVSILQALAMMNGKVTADATTLERSETLASVIDAPFLTHGQRIETLYLATLARKPEQKELDRALKFVQDAVRKARGKKGAASNALADVFWALLNSPEFILNH
jgi:hypothetical protein